MIGLGSSSTLGIGLIIQLRDQFTQNANKISKSMNSLHADSQRALKNSFNTMIGTGAAITTVGLVASRSLIRMTKDAVAFEKVLRNVKALSGDMTEAQMFDIGKLAQSLGGKYGRSPIEVAAGMEDLVKAGLKAKEIPMVMEAIIQTATAAGEKLEGEEGVAARMIDLMMAWGMKANQAFRAGDILAKASIESTVSFNDLAESMKYSQDILKSLNLTFEESVAMMAVLGNAGIKASMSGTALGNAWREIAIAISGRSDKKNKALDMLGISKQDLMDAQGNLKRPLEILDRIKQGIKGMGDVQRQNVLNDLFGVRGKRGINPLIDFLSKGPNDKWMGKSLSDMVKELSLESAGSNMKIINEQMKSASFWAEKIKANWINFKIAVGAVILPLASKLLPILNQILIKATEFAGTPFGKFIIGGAAIISVLLVPLGIMVTLIGLTGRMLMATTAGFAPFRKAALWAWNSVIARALTYLGILRGIGAQERMNSAGSVIDSVTGRIKVPAFKTPMGRIIQLFNSMLPVLGKVIRVFSIIGIVSGALAMVGISLRNQFNYLVAVIKWTIGSIANVIMGILELIPGVNFGGGGFMNRQDKLGATTFGQARNSSITNNYDVHKDYVRPNENMNFEKFIRRQDTVVHIYVDGKKSISKTINSGTEDELMTKYGFNN